jgi:hypothetical protein
VWDNKNYVLKSFKLYKSLKPKAPPVLVLLQVKNHQIGKLIRLVFCSKVKVTVLNFLNQRSFLRVKAQQFDGIFEQVLLDELVESVFDTLGLNFHDHFRTIHQYTFLTARYVVG